MTEFEQRISLLAQAVLKEMKHINIFPDGKIASVKENRRARKRLGCCRMKQAEEGNEFEIEISRHLESMDDRFIKEVIAHELLHSCRGCMNHGSQWKELAAKMNSAYGYHIKRTIECGKENGDSGAPDRRKYRYCIQCKKCGNTTYRMRKSRVVTDVVHYRCAVCGGRLKVTDIQHQY